MADLTCTTPFVLYPLLVIILFFYSLNHHTGFLSSVVNDDPSCHHSVASSSVFSSFRFFPLRSSSSCLTTLNNSSSSEVTVVDEAAERIEEGLAMARAAIQKAGEVNLRKNSSDLGLVSNGSIYLNAFAFHQSHREMKKRFKIWTYREGEAPLFHEGPLNDIYAIEASPEEATMFYIPVGIVSIIRFVYRPYTSYARDRLQNIVKDYISLVSNRYPYWNRTRGADHFFLSCHDWAPDVSTVDPELYKHFIRALCNANASEGSARSTRGRTASKPETISIFRRRFSRRSTENTFPTLERKGQRRPCLRVSPKTINYTRMMDQAKFCLCPSGWEVASPRIVESLYSGCVPVIIADSYVLPFSDVLNWKRFSVQIPVRKIPEIKKILEGVSEEEYLEMQRRVLEVRKHFVVNRPSKPYDMLHMVMHSLWLRRLNVRIPFHSETICC
ncbi:hypothetical protein Bca52824_050821 [Brassica carinata]|uniref:Exostosin GT47 domain-containing protein n=1 Tax=Brassica carinata TaxID=52824 RepID=A0A8X7UJ77_BRACI|nr:hypothetical protein Bca52824_050821 [Brassica carinata]